VNGGEVEAFVEVAGLVAPSPVSATYTRGWRRYLNASAKPAPAGIQDAIDPVWDGAMPEFGRSATNRPGSRPCEGATSFPNQRASTSRGSTPRRNQPARPRATVEK